jgi:formylmethanofuran dehydrogenase subunit D
MCASCAHQDEDCSALPFKDMPHLVVKQEEGESLVIVRCTEFERSEDSGH